MSKRPFPNDFLWGASTASHQVEGGTRNQWTEWERQNAQRLADTAFRRFRGFSNWQDIAAQAQDPANYLSGNGVEHYTLYADDIALLNELHMNTFRFGIEWSRIEPQPGKWDTEAIAHYQDYMRVLKERRITPIVTLWHWTMPVWFADRGGFSKRANLRYFDQYVEKIAEIFGSDLQYIITLNEPNVYVAFGYGIGEWPPAKKNPWLALRTYRNLAEAHRRAYRILKGANPALQVGVAAQLADTRPVSPRNPVNRSGVAAKLYAWNWWFLNRIAKHQDFIGLNYYFTEHQDWLCRIKNPSGPVSDLGWYMEPSGIEDLLVAVHMRYEKPVIITENGLADAHDTHRQWWLEQTLPALERAIRRGVMLRGYLHWSLLDNFEWAYGWWPKFGLVQVDRTTMKRTVRPSARWFADRIKRYQ